MEKTLKGIVQYARKNYFSYYLSIHRELKFDIDDLFYYSSPSQPSRTSA